MDDIVDFLRERDVKEHQIQKMKDDKIDMHVINVMDDDTLSEYLPLVGDRLMLREKCKSKQKSSKKESLFTILKKKMKPCNPVDNSKESNQFMVNKTSSRKKHNATKNTRRIQIGWIHEGRTLRTSSGGGTRKVEIDKEDYQRVPMPDGVTVGDVYDISKMDGMLRFYLCTTEKPKTCSTKHLAAVKPIISSHKFNQSQVEIDRDETIMFGRKHSTPTKSVLAETISFSDSDVSIPSLDSPAMSTSSIDRLMNEPLPNDIVAQAIALAGIEDDWRAEENVKENVTWCVNVVKVHRGQVFADMITYLKGINIVDNQTFEVKMVLPDGNEEAAEDNGGLFRDALSEFWETFYLTCTLGETIRVPTTIHTMQDEDWMAVSKVIYVGYKQESFFPNRLAIPFIRYCLTGDSKTSQTELLAAFMDYLPEIDRTTIQCALNDFDEVDRDELLDVLSSRDVRTNPTKQNITNILQEVAHKELLQDPAYIADCWRPIFKSRIKRLILDDINTLYSSLSPTVKKVLGILSFPDEMSREQGDTKVFLEKYVKSLSPLMLEKFLRFCTGSTLLIGKQIKVYFSKAMSDFTRRPIGRTCGCVLNCRTVTGIILNFERNLVPF